MSQGGYMPVTQVDPDSTEDPIEKVTRTIIELEANGHTIVDIVEFPNQMPRQSSYLIITADGAVVTRVVGK